MADPTAPAAPQAAPSAPATIDAPIAEGQAGSPAVAPVEPARDPSLPPRYSELGKQQAARKAEADDRAAREQDARDAQAYRALVAAGYSPREAASQVVQPQPPKAPARGRKVEIDLDDHGSLRAAIGDDKLFREYLNGTARHVVSPDITRLERELASSKAKLPEDYDELRTTVKTIAEQREAESIARTEQAFLASAESKGDDDAARFPILARLAPAKRLAFARGVLQDYAENGVDPSSISIDFLAEATEEFLASHLAELAGQPAATPAPQPAAPRAPAAAPTPRPQGTPPKRSSQGTRSLTNAMATPGSTPKDPGKMTPAERSAWALQRHKARRAASPPS
jgi:hypothetical protein